MSEPHPTLSPDYFESLYATNLDPWKFATSPYERDKYALTLAALPGPRYRSALEIGCSIGVLTSSRASRCHAVARTRRGSDRCSSRRGEDAPTCRVRFEHMFVPEQWPDGVFELILLSEVVYYLSPEDVGRLASRVTRSLSRGGSVILVHWTGQRTIPSAATRPPLSLSNGSDRHASSSAGIDIPNFGWMC